MIILREYEKAHNKLKNIRENPIVSPMRTVNFYCRFCCPDLPFGEKGTSCQNPNCPFGILKKKMDAVRMDNGRESILSLPDTHPYEDVGKKENRSQKCLKTQLNGIPEETHGHLWDYTIERVLP